MSAPAATLARLLPERSNRTLWWLVSLMALAFAVLGPVPAAVALTGVFHTSLTSVLPALVVANVVTVVVVATLMLVVLRGDRPVAAGRAIEYVLVVAAVGTILRLAVYWAIGPDFGLRFVAFQVALALVYVGSVAAAIVYGSTLEHALSISYATNARTQAALSHEEEAVRAQVFDQLHGSLQAEFVSAGRTLTDLADRTSDPDAAATATEVAERLEVVYRRGVETVARALSPAGLDVGLAPAVRELQTRVAGSTALDLQIDPIVTVLDDPLTGGMRRDVRVAAYRVIEEAVSNAIRHSSADVVDVAISSALNDGQPQLLLRIANARSSRVEVADGQGLIRMRSRVTALGGDVQVLSSEDAFTVTARLPLQSHDPAGESVA